MAAPHRSRARRIRQQTAEAQAVANAIGYSVRTIVALRRRVFLGKIALAVAVIEAVALVVILSGIVQP